MQVRALHDWHVSVHEAAEIQRDLAARVDTQGDADAVRLVAGVDVGLPRGVGRAAVTLLNLPDLAIVETAVAEMAPPFPYIPGFLSFRETPIVAEALARLNGVPDLVIVDGQGIAHPRRLGVAAHLGVLLDIPTIGCAKSRLVGTAPDPGPSRGDREPLVHRHEVIGAVLRTRPRVKPIFVSVGHRIGLDAAVAWTLRLTTRYRLPEPIRAAHRAASG